MVDINDILQWKQQYGDLYQMQIQEQHFIFRPLGREEYKQVIIMDLELGEFQEIICMHAIIYPESYDYSKGIAGIAEVLSDGIMDASGLHMGQAAELLDDYRSEMLNYDYQVDCLIHEAFPEYTLDEISTWPIRKTMFYLSRAEWIIGNLKGVSLQRIDDAINEEYNETKQQQQQAPPQPPPNPSQRPIRKELIEGPEQPKEQPQVSKPVPEGGVQSEEELLAMLSGSGAKISKPSANMDDMKPELGWFKHDDELRGTFDD